MRTTTFGFLASLLAGGALATQTEKRDIITENVYITEEIIVEVYLDEVLETITGFAKSTVCTVIVSSTLASTSSPVSVSSASPSLLQVPSPSYSHIFPTSSKPTVSTTTAAPALTTSSSSIALTSTAAQAPSSIPKRGLAYNDISLLSGFVSSAISWCYNWGPCCRWNRPLQPLLRSHALGIRLPR